MGASLDVGIAFDVRPAAGDEDPGGPDDRYEELDSEATIEAVAEALREAGHHPRPMGGGAAFLEAMLARPPQLVFNMAEGLRGRSREAHVPAVCEMLDVPYTHSDPLTLAATLDKPVAKMIVAGAGVPTPRFEIVTRPPDATALAFPVIAKPAAEGSGIGIRSSSRLTDVEALRRDVQRLLRDYDQPVLIEEFCPGAELTVGVVGTGRAARALGVMEIRPKHVPVGQFVYSVEAKRSGFDAVEYVLRDDAEALQAAGVAVAAHRALQCRDVSRIDLRIDAAGAVSFLEANPLPGIAPGWGDLIVLTEKAGLSYTSVIAMIVDGARERLDI